MNQLIRSFIALELNQDIKDELKTIQDALKKLTHRNQKECLKIVNDSLLKNEK